LLAHENIKLSTSDSDKFFQNKFQIQIIANKKYG